MESYLTNHLKGIVYIEAVDILFYFKSANDKYRYIVNLFITLGKFFIHKSKFRKQKPRFNIFLTDLQIYCSSLKNSREKKALKCVRYFSEYDLLNE